MKFLARALVSLVVTFFLLIPTWIYLLAHYFTQPNGFWQELALGVIGLWVLGGIQFFFLMLLVVSCIKIWTEK